MSNLVEARPKVTRIMLRDGKERELCYTLNAMAEMEDRYGSVDEAFAMLDKGSFKAIRFMLWAGLMNSDENLTETQVGGLIDMQCLEELMAKVGQAFNNDMPAKGETVPNDQLPTAQ